MIPPPYPFPVKWPALFQQQHQQQAAQWLTPYTQILPRHVIAGSAPFPVPGYSAAPPYPQPESPPPIAMHPPRVDVSWQEQASTVDQYACESIGEDESDDDDYEYGYVLNDDWRQYLQDNVLSDDESGEHHHAQQRQHQHQHQHQRSRKPDTQQPKRTRGSKKHQPATLAHRAPSQLELALDTARELERQRRQQRLSPITTVEDMSSAREEASSRPRHVANSAATAFTGCDPKTERVPGLPSGEDDRHSSLQVVEHLEATLHVSFEAFCDNNSPAVWPQGAS